MTLRHYLLAAALLLCGLSSTHAINRAELIKYAQTLKGKKGAELKTALHTLLVPKTVLEYGSGTENTWWGFWYTDRDPKTNIAAMIIRAGLLPAPLSLLCSLEL